MKKVNILLGVLLAALLALTAVFFYGAVPNLTVSAAWADAPDHPDAFRSIQGVLSSGGAPAVFSDEQPLYPEGCRLGDLTVTVENRGFLPLEWLRPVLTPAEGDIAVYSLSGEGTDVAARSAGAVNVKLLTRAEAQAPRAISIEYYVFGMKRTARATLP